jgi:hypothetical protein
MTSAALHVAVQLTVQLMVFATLTGPAAAQEASNPPPPPSAAEPPPPSAAVPPPSPASSPVNVAKLPIDLGRLQRRLRASAERSQQDGMNLKVFVDVYAFAPPLLLFTREDILGDGAVPGGAPTHQQIIDQNTPEEHRGSNTVRKGGIKILGGKK